jgi:hypothetical protein
MRTRISLVVAVPLAALVVAGPTATAQEEEQSVVHERSSGVAFPVELTVPGTEMTHVITGTGIRTKTFLKVKVYAFGLYVDPAGARTALVDYAGTEGKELEKNDEFFDTVLEQDFGMTLRLVMTRDVGGEDMAEAFDGALRPRVQRAAAEMDMPGGEAALDEFRGFFNVEEMTKESDIVFSCTPDGMLRTSVKGEVQAEITSEALCWALFDVYLGEDPISGGGKKNIGKAFADVLSAM